MITGTYLGSAVIVAALGVLLITTRLTTWEFMGLVLGAFFLASAGASAAYLTVSEVFPMETRALAIAFFFAIGTATGGIVGPALFGQLINSGRKDLVALGFLIGAGAMSLGGISELFFGVRAEGQSLEDIAKPLAAEEAEGLMPLPFVPEKPQNPDVYHEQHEALRAREQAESERASPQSGGPHCRSTLGTGTRQRPATRSSWRQSSPSSVLKSWMSWRPPMRSGPERCRRNPPPNVAWPRPAAAAEQQAGSTMSGSLR